MNRRDIKKIKTPENLKTIPNLFEIEKEGNVTDKFYRQKQIKEIIDSYRHIEKVLSSKQNRNQEEDGIISFIKQIITTLNEVKIFRQKTHDKSQIKESIDDINEQINNVEDALFLLQTYQHKTDRKDIKDISKSAYDYCKKSVEQRMPHIKKNTPATSTENQHEELSLSSATQAEAENILEEDDLIVDLDALEDERPDGSERKPLHNYLQSDKIIGRGSYGVVIRQKAIGPLLKILLEKNMCRTDGIICEKNMQDPSEITQESQIGEKAYKTFVESGKSNPPYNLVLRSRKYGQPVILTRYEPNGSALEYDDNILKKTPEKAAANITKQFVTLMLSVTAFHQTGHLHLDIAARNIFIDEFGRALLADYGLAKKYPLEGPLPEIGPIRWMDSMRMNLKKATPASDLYSLKVAMIEILAAACGMPVASVVCDDIEDVNAIAWQIGTEGENAVLKKYKDILLAKIALKEKDPKTELITTKAKPGFEELYNLYQQFEPFLTAGRLDVDDPEKQRKKDYDNFIAGCMKLSPDMYDAQTKSALADLSTMTKTLQIRTEKPEVEAFIQSIPSIQSVESASISQAPEEIQPTQETAEVSPTVYKTIPANESGSISQAPEATQSTQEPPETAATETNKATQIYGRPDEELKTAAPASNYGKIATPPNSQTQDTAITPEEPPLTQESTEAATTTYKTIPANERNQSPYSGWSKKAKTTQSPYSGFAKKPEETKTKNQSPYGEPIIVNIDEEIQPTQEPPETPAATETNKAANYGRTDEALKALRAAASTDNYGRISTLPEPYRDAGFIPRTEFNALLKKVETETTHKIDQVPAINLAVGTIHDIKKQILQGIETLQKDGLHEYKDGAFLVKYNATKELDPLNPFHPREGEIQALRYLHGMLLIAESCTPDISSSLLKNIQETYKAYLENKKPLTDEASRTHQMGEAFAKILSNHFNIDMEHARKQVTMGRDLGILLENHPSICTISKTNDQVTIEQAATTKISPAYYEKYFTDIPNQPWFGYAKKFAGFDADQKTPWLEAFFEKNYSMLQHFGIPAPSSARWLPSPANNQEIETYVADAKDIEHGTSNRFIRMGTIVPVAISDRDLQYDLAKDQLKEIIRLNVIAQFNQFKATYEELIKNGKLKNEKGKLDFYVDYQTLLSPWIIEKKLHELPFIGKKLAKLHKDNNGKFVQMAKDAMAEIAPALEVEINSELQKKYPGEYDIDLHFCHTNASINKWAGKEFIENPLIEDDPADRESRKQKIKTTQSLIIKMLNLDPDFTFKSASKSTIEAFANRLQKGNFSDKMSKVLQQELALRMRAAFHLRQLLSDKEPYNKLAAYDRNLMMAALEHLTLGNQSLTLAGCKSARDRTAIFAAAIKTMMENPAAMADIDVLNEGIIRTLIQGQHFRAMLWHTAVAKIGAVHKKILGQLPLETQNKIAEYKRFSKTLDDYEEYQAEVDKKIGKDKVEKTPETETASAAQRERRGAVPTPPDMQAILKIKLNEFATTDADFRKEIHGFAHHFGIDENTLKNENAFLNANVRLSDKEKEVLLIALKPYWKIADNLYANLSAINSEAIQQIIDQFKADTTTLDAALEAAKSLNDIEDFDYYFTTIGGLRKTDTGRELNMRDVSKLLALRFFNHYAEEFTALSKLAEKTGDKESMGKLDEAQRYAKQLIEKINTAKPKESPLSESMKITIDHINHETRYIFINYPSDQTDKNRLALIERIKNELDSKPLYEEKIAYLRAILDKESKQYEKEIDRHINIRNVGDTTLRSHLNQLLTLYIKGDSWSHAYYKNKIDSTLLHFNHEPSMTEIHDSLAKEKRDMSQYIFRGALSDDKNDRGTFSGSYSIPYTVQTPDGQIVEKEQPVSFKQDIHNGKIQNGKMIAEFIGAGIMMTENAAPVFFVTQPSSEKTASNIYIGTVGYKNQVDLYKVLGFKERPQTVSASNKDQLNHGFYKTDLDGNFILDSEGRIQCAYKNFNEVIVASLRAGDADIHVGKFDLMLPDIDKKYIEDRIATAWSKLGFSGKFDEFKDADLLLKIVNDNVDSRISDDTLKEFAKRTKELDINTIEKEKDPNEILSKAIAREIKYFLIRKGFIEAELVKTHHDNTLRKMTPDIMPSYRQHMWIGLEPSNPIREFPSDLQINPGIAAELLSQAKLDLIGETAKKIEALMKDVADFYDFASILDFARNLSNDFNIDQRLIKSLQDAGYPDASLRNDKLTLGKSITEGQTNTIAKEAILRITKEFLQQRIHERGESLERLANEIKLGLCLKKDSIGNFSIDETKFAKFLEENPEYLLKGDFRFRSSDQRANMGLFKMKLPLHDELTDKVMKALRQPENIFILTKAAVDKLKNNDFSLLNTLLSHEMLHKSRNDIKNTLDTLCNGNTDITNKVTPFLLANHPDLLPHEVTPPPIAPPVAPQSIAKAAPQTAFINATTTTSRSADSYDYLRNVEKTTQENELKATTFNESDVDRKAKEFNEISAHIFSSLDFAKNGANAIASLEQAANNLSYYIAKKVLDLSTVQARSSLLEFYIAVMRKSAEMNDYHTAGAILSALTALRNGEKLFLPETHNALSANAKKIESYFVALFNQNAQFYHAIANRENPVIPYYENFKAVLNDSASIAANMQTIQQQYIETHPARAAHFNKEQQNILNLENKQLNDLANIATYVRQEQEKHLSASSYKKNSLMTDKEVHLDAGIMKSITDQRAQQTQAQENIRRQIEIQSAIKDKKQAIEVTIKNIEQYITSHLYNDRLHRERKQILKDIVAKFNKESLIQNTVQPGLDEIKIHLSNKESPLYKHHDENAKGDTKAIIHLKALEDAVTALQKLLSEQQNLSEKKARTDTASIKPGTLIK